MLITCCDFAKSGKFSVVFGKGSADKVLSSGAIAGGTFGDGFTGGRTRVACTRA